jgi:predicted phage terminase large subunit-like protein
VGLASYGRALALNHARAARQYYLDGGGRLRLDHQAAGDWATTGGGELYCGGVRGPFTGRGYHLGIVDDPVKDAVDAASPRMRQSLTEWWQSVWRSRCEPDAALVVIQTRWSEDDLSGWLLKRAQEGQGELGWHIVHLPAVAEEEPYLAPPGCTVEPDWRRPGEALCPERYPLSELQRLQQESGPYAWAALYQQRPAPLEGGMFRREWFHEVQEPPVGARWVRYWDKAGTSGGDGARTAGALLGRSGNGYCLADIVSGRWEAVERERRIDLTAAMDREKYGMVVTWVEQEPGSGGKESAQATQRRLSAAGYPCRIDMPQRNKVVRAEPLAAAMCAGLVSCLSGAWLYDFQHEAVNFPNGRLKDMVDAAAGAYNRLATPARVAPQFSSVERPG